MIELLLTVCLLSEPKQCKDISLLYANTSSAQCLVSAQPEMARWALSHPEQNIQSWKCQTVFANRDA
ncbi:MAG: hypothetical protein COB16_08430 [Rhodobacteraceae bacterium]|nr:MAG: hypothetical protein COB16_08430 [Paracoccaceae bacterium]